MNKDFGHETLSILWRRWLALEEHGAAFGNGTWAERFGAGSGQRALLEPLTSGRLGELALPESKDPVPGAEPGRRLTDAEFLVFCYLQLATSKGQDLRLDLQPFAGAHTARQTIDPGSWKWKVLSSYKWTNERETHINVLETQAVFDLARKLARQTEHMGQRKLVLVDNQAAIGAIRKGRSSSRLMMRPLRRLMAVVTAGNLRLALGWVRTDWNPADGPSRWAQKRGVNMNPAG